MEFKTQEQIAISYLEKMKRNFSRYRSESVSIAIKTLEESGDLRKFSTREKAYSETFRLNRNLKKERIEDVSRIIHVIYNDLNRTAGYSEEINKILRAKVVSKYKLRK